MSLEENNILDMYSRTLAYVYLAIGSILFRFANKIKL